MGKKINMRLPGDPVIEVLSFTFEFPNCVNITQFPGSSAWKAGILPLSAWFAPTAHEFSSFGYGSLFFLRKG